MLSGGQKGAGFVKIVLPFRNIRRGAGGWFSRLGEGVGVNRGLLGLGLLLVLWGLGMARMEPLLPMAPRVLPGGVEATEHGLMDRKRTVLVVHSIFQGRESSWPMAQALARRGLNAVNLHLRGGLEYSQYVGQISAAVDFYAERGPVSLWGHSMGADLVAEAGSQNSRVEGVVAAGFPVTSSTPRLLLVVGAWDQLHTIEEMRQAARQLTPPAGVEVLLRADHNQENFDPESSRRAAEFLGGEAAQRRGDPYLGRGWLAWGVILLCAAWYGGPSRRLQGGTLLLALVTWSSDPYHTVARALLSGLAVAQGRAGWLNSRQMLALVLAIGLGELVVAWPNWTAQPALLLAFPAAFLSWLPSGLLKFAGDIPVWGWAVLGVLEVVRPGVVMRALCWLPRSTWQKFSSFSMRAPTRGQCVVLALLLVGAGLAWWNVVQAGYWPEPDQWKMLFSKVGGLVVVPLLVWLLAARWLQA